jgi:DNA-binding IclR family transcriptional regulator
MKRSKSEYVIQTVTNALRLLEQFGDEEELGVTELSKRLDLHKNNVFRLLATLEERSYVEQSSGSDRYRLGPRCLELGQALVRNRSLARHGRAALEALVRETGESAHLGALDGFEVMHLDGEQPDRLLVTSLRVGRRLGAHCTALGKTLLACGEPALRGRFDREVIAQAGLVARTAATFTDREKFLDHLGDVARQGFALDLEECEAGLSCVAAPVHDASGAVVAALSISAPSQRLDPEALLQETVPRVVEAAGRLSRDLGHRA